MKQEILNKISIIVPSLNPDEKLCKTINSLLDIGFTDIICINDGSREDCHSFFPKDTDNVTILTHEVNRGKGAALKTAFAYIKDNRPDSLGAVTVDGDGQHAAEDVLNCALEMIDKDEFIILGCRDFSEPQVPKKSRYGNKITSAVFKLLCGMKISDTQTGLRAIPSKYYSDMLEIYGDRFEYETNMLLEMKARKIPFSEVKIDTVYIEENRTSHFRPFKDSFRIYSLILKFTLGQFVKFTLSSVASFVVDCLLVYLLLSLFENALDINFEIKNFTVAWVTFCSKAIARVFSSLFNYSVNRQIVFPTDMPLKKSIVKYYCLALPLLVVSSTLTAIFENIPIFDSAFSIVLLSFIIDFVLFFANYYIQKKWVFKK
ncbi:MAG: glycosyltransferase [Clostridia bacterium]|nr:glycosyltransferase [Clostridia bacterium]